MLEGILMQGPDMRAIVVRTPEGSLVKKVENYTPLKEKSKILGWPVIRGCAVLFTSLYHGVKALTYSAEFFPEDEQEPGKQSKLDKWFEQKLSTKGAQKIISFFGVAIGVILALLLFFILPTYFAELIAKDVSSSIIKNLIEGAIRIIIFLGYLYGCSRIKDIKRVFRYHGAEHKSIFCYESGQELTVENARKFSCHHPRCGTSFLFVVMIISILVFSLIQWQSVLMRVVLRLLLLPIVIGISYEINRFAGRHESWFTKIITAPGLWLQNITTGEPDDSMLEVGIESLKLVIPQEEGKDEW